jgi:hypothetical protein
VGPDLRLECRGRQSELAARRTVRRPTIPRTYGPRLPCHGSLSSRSPDREPPPVCRRRGPVRPPEMMPQRHLAVLRRSRLRPWPVLRARWRVPLPRCGLRQGRHSLRRTAWRSYIRTDPTLLSSGASSTAQQSDSRSMPGKENSHLLNHALRVRAEDRVFSARDFHDMG